jgi:four helix bundle protein
MGTFEDLRAFQRAVDLSIEIYTATESFPRSELYGLTSQLRRAAVSVVSSIAEGQGRCTYGEWRQMLGTARGSLYEVQAQCIIAKRLNLLSDASTEHLRRHIRGTARALAGLIAWVQRREAQTKQRPGAKPPTTDNR